MKVLFLHGWQSVPGGVKPTFLARHGHEVVNPKLPDEDFAEAVRIAQAEEWKRHGSARAVKPGTVICTAGPTTWCRSPAVRNWSGTAGCRQRR